jgi:hypothetical protein
MKYFKSKIENFVMNKKLQYFFVFFTVMFSNNMFSQTFDGNIANKLQFKIDSLKNEYSIEGAKHFSRIIPEI